MDQENSLDFSTILASTIHDMKNSIGMVLNSLEEVISESDGGFSADRASQIQYEARRVNDNLIQLLTLYKVENDRLGVNITEHDVLDFLEESALHGKSMLDYRGITIDIDCEPDLYWYFDRELMAGVVNNALDNAVRYTRDRLRLVASVNDGELVIELEDNGRGFPDSMLVSSEPGVGKVDFHTGRTGLGLYFSSLVAGLHRNRQRVGYIEQRNGGELGGGIFSIHLP